jgi:hypothetical protein
MIPADFGNLFRVLLKEIDSALTATQIPRCGINLCGEVTCVWTETQVVCRQQVVPPLLLFWFPLTLWRHWLGFFKRDEGKRVLGTVFRKAGICQQAFNHWVAERTIARVPVQQGKPFTLVPNYQRLMVTLLKVSDEDPDVLASVSARYPQVFAVNIGEEVSLRAPAGSFAPFDQQLGRRCPLKRIYGIYPVRSASVPVLKLQ